jgi:ubiquinone/menaquinone biosynthesis C-methylase UbiE
MTSSFDSVASNFERFRALPSGVPEVIRSAIWTAVQITPPARVLDLGAGTGRFGKAFIEAGDDYVGVDNSLSMLHEFQSSSRKAFLAQADGRQLPFNNRVFDVVLLMHFLSGADDWQRVIDEALRVCRRGGIIVVGSTVSPESGIDTQLKQQLKVILEEMGIAWHRTRQAHREALRYLELLATRHVHAKATAWNVLATSQDFLQRHRSGARFAALPTAVQEQALQRLKTWAEGTFGSVDIGFNEQRSFELDIFEL